MSDQNEENATAAQYSIPQVPQVRRVEYRIIPSSPLQNYIIVYDCSFLGEKS